MASGDQWEQRLLRMEALVERSLCKCIVGPYWRAGNNCQVHSPYGIGPAQPCSYNVKLDGQQYYCVGYLPHDGHTLRAPVDASVG